MHVRWTDGPISGQVDAIVNKYAGGHFNGSDDSYTYTADAWNEAFGDARYVFTNRDLSDKAIASAIRTFCAKFEGNLGDMANTITVEAYRAGKLRTAQVPELGGCYGIGDLISQIAYARTWALDMTPKAKPMNELIETAA